MRTKKFKIDMVSDTEARCRICKQVKPLNEFRANTGQWESKNFRLSFCNSCRNKKRRDSLHKNPISLLRSKLQNSKQRAKEKDIEFNITAEYLISLWEKQGGKCYYTNEPMFLGQDRAKRPSSVSLDRVDCTKGYIKGNVVLCSDRINSIKNNLTLKELQYWIPRIYSKIQKFYGK